MTYPWWSRRCDNLSSPTLATESPPVYFVCEFNFLTPNGEPMSVHPLNRRHAIALAVALTASVPTLSLAQAKIKVDGI